MVKFSKYLIMLIFFFSENCNNWLYLNLQLKFFSFDNYIQNAKTPFWDHDQFGPYIQVEVNLISVIFNLQSIQSLLLTHNRKCLRNKQFVRLACLILNQMLTYLDFNDHVSSYMAKKAISSLKNICICTNSFPYKKHSSPNLIYASPNNIYFDWT